jgi:hypothetical protein
MSDLEQAEANLIAAKQALMAGLEYVDFVKRGLPKSAPDAKSGCDRGRNHRMPATSGLPFWPASSRWRSHLTKAIFGCWRPARPCPIRPWWRRFCRLSGGHGVARFRPSIAHIAENGETEHQHRPGRGLGN